MKLTKETEKLIARAVGKWSRLKALEQGSKESWASNTRKKSPAAETEFDNPNLLWLFVKSDDGDYDGDSFQLGLTKDGRIMWQYQSHCSCDGFDDVEGEGSSIPEDTTKIYELNNLPKDWEAIVQFNLKKLLSFIN